MEKCKYCGVSLDARGLHNHELKCENKATDNDINESETSHIIDSSECSCESKVVDNDLTDSDKSLLMFGAVVSIFSGLIGLGSYLLKKKQGA